MSYIRSLSIEGDFLLSTVAGSAEVTDVAGSRTKVLDTLCVAPGVWAVAMPFPSPLGYSFAYFVKAEEGVIVVDLGWDSEEAWEVFRRGLRRAAVSFDDIVGVVVTHVHPDHYGLAGRVRAETDAWIACHPAETQYIVGPSDRRAWNEALTTWLRECGVPGSGDLGPEITRLVETMPRSRPSVLLRDGDAVPGTAGAMRAVHTPGHTAGHLCFRDHERRLLFTGDHVLPRVTPNISKRPGYGDDPLGDYLCSLRKLEPMAGEVDMVLPGHEWPFDHPEGRIATLSDHHAERLREVEAAVTGGAETVWDVAGAIAWSRPFGGFDPRAQRQALGETLAHLARLEAGKRVASRHRAGVVEWGVSM